MSYNAIDDIVKCMAAGNENTDIQRVQTEHRLKLALYWGISEGSKVLEIGCGQGDMTAVLAYLVGDRGFVQGLDSASPNYGSPVTLGDSADYLKKSKLGRQIKMDFEVDLLSDAVDFPDYTFDVIVMSHCSWYFKSAEEFAEALKRLRKWGKQLCFAEWDPRIKTIEQNSHFLAVMLQAQYECYKESRITNVRTLFTPYDVQRLLEEAGWTIVHEESIVSSELQDGQWEVQNALAEYHHRTTLPAKLESLLASQVYLLEESIKNHPIKPMSTYALRAE